MAAAGAGGVPVACAACRYQRRRCGEKCPLAPYFPRDRPRVFRNAHRLFGVSNILKTLDRAGADPGRRHEAMQCIVYESQAWDLYPSAGCVPIIVGLQNRIQQAEHELRRVHADLEADRRAAAFAQAGGRPAVHRPDNYDDGARYSANEGIAAARDNAAITSNGGNMAPPSQTLPWTTQPPHQPIVNDMMNYFADGINGENDAMPRESSMDSSGEKAMRNAPAKMKDNNDFDHQAGY